MSKSRILQHLLAVSILLSSPSVSAQVETFRVQFNQVDANYSSTEDSTAISRNTNARTGKLFLFFGGTGSNSSIAYDGLRRHAAGLGFDVINLNYTNDVAAASLKDSPDSLAFNKYREEICFGTPASDAVSVDSLNSISTRTEKLIRYLDSVRPSDGWVDYLTSTGAVEWTKVVVGGHSQGAGHAAYLGKRFSMERVLMFSGPNDYSDQFSKAANWLTESGVTPATRHFAYLSLEDEIVDFSKQFENVSALNIQDSTYIDNSMAPFMNAHLLYTTQSLGSNHSAPIRISIINRDVWTYMLTTSIASSVTIAEEAAPTLMVFPNPTHNVLQLISKQLVAGKAYSLRTVTGQLLLSGQLSESDLNSIDVSGVPSGIHLLTVDRLSTMVVIK